MMLTLLYLFPPSAYTEAYNVCAVAAAPPSAAAVAQTSGEDDQGRTSEEEDGAADSNYDRQVGLRSLSTLSSTYLWPKKPFLNVNRLIKQGVFHFLSQTELLMWVNGRLIAAQTTMCRGKVTTYLNFSRPGLITTTWFLTRVGSLTAGPEPSTSPRSWWTQRDSKWAVNSSHPLTSQLFYYI